MTIEERLSNLEDRFNSLQASFIQAQQNSVEVTARADVGFNKPDAPYEATETVYYGETSKNFYNVPQGNITVFWDNYAGDYAVERNDDVVTVSFGAIEVAEATISIMVQ